MFRNEKGLEKDEVINRGELVHEPRMMPDERSTLPAPATGKALSQGSATCRRGQV